MSTDANLAEQVFHQFLALTRIHRQYARRIIDEQGIKPRNLSVLRFLSEHDAVTVSQIQEYIQHSPSTTSTMIADMETVGYVERTRSEADRRVVFVTLTPKGHSMLAQTPLGGSPLLHRELQALSAERLAEMASVLTELNALMQEQAHQ
jgi:DNA-binding MarR family transcriptional regulator